MSANGSLNSMVEPLELMLTKVAELITLLEVMQEYVSEHGDLTLGHLTSIATRHAGNIGKDVAKLVAVYHHQGSGVQP